MTADPEMGRGMFARFFAAELRIWRGEAPLARVFWFHGVLLSSVLLALFGAAIYFEHRLAEQVMMIYLGIYSVWILVAIWRCAARDASVWSQFARLLTVAWALNVGMILAFRELDLIARFLRD